MEVLEDPNEAMDLEYFSFVMTRHAIRKRRVISESSSTSSYTSEISLWPQAAPAILDTVRGRSDVPKDHPGLSHSSILQLGSGSMPGKLVGSGKGIVRRRHSCSYYLSIVWRI